MSLNACSLRLFTAITIAFFFAPLVSRVAASKPDRTIEVVVNEQDTNMDCGFPVISSISGKFDTKLYFDSDGNFVRDHLHVQLHGTFTNPENGVALTFVVAENSSFAVYDDGTSTITFNGLTGKVTIPHQGEVAAAVGRIVFFFDGPDDEEPDVIFESGHRDDGPFPTLCSYL